MKKELYTEIEIDAPPEKVWRLLTDFAGYPEWNPFIRNVKGSPSVGNRIEILIGASGSRAMKFKPEILIAEEQKELRWLGNLLSPALFAGEHYFRIEPNSRGGVKFIHGEMFDGLLVGLMAKSLDHDTLRGFREMNEALKNRAEC